MKKWTDVVVGVGLVLLVAARLFAQSGCTDSPENPTVVLALVGGAGALYSALKTRVKGGR